MTNNQQLGREKQLYDYLDAFEHGDIAQMQILLRQAERDPQLSQMIQDIHAALDAESQSSVSINSSKSHKQNGSNHMAVRTLPSLPYQTDSRHQRFKPRPSSPLTMIATLAVMTLVSTVLLAFYLNGGSEANLLAPTEQVEETAQLQLFNRYIAEVWNAADPVAADELVLPSHIYTEVGNSDGPMIGSPALLRKLQESHDIAPDMTLTIDNAIENGDQVWAVLTVSMSEVEFGEGNIFTPTYGDKFINSATMIVTVRDNQIAETWFDLNITSFFWDFTFQMGVDDFSLQEQQNIAAAERIYDELWNNPEPDVEVVRELYFRAFTVKDDFWGNETNTGPAKYLRTNIMPMRNTMPDLNYTVHTIAADGDQIMAHYTANGTWQNPICENDALSCDPEQAIPPTNEPITWSGVTVYRFEDNHVVEQWEYMDSVLMFTIFEQAGVEFIWPDGSGE